MGCPSMHTIIYHDFITMSVNRVILKVDNIDKKSWIIKWWGLDAIGWDEFPKYGYNDCLNYKVNSRCLFQKYVFSCTTWAILYFICTFSSEFNLHIELWNYDWADSDEWNKIGVQSNGFFMSLDTS